MSETGFVFIGIMLFPFIWWWYNGKTIKNWIRNYKEDKEYKGNKTYNPNHNDDTDW